MQPMKRIGALALAVAAVLSAGVVTQADASPVTFSFFNITNNGNPQVGSQLAVAIDAVGLTGVDFKFTNAVGIASSIAQIYFDEGTTASPLKAGTSATPSPMTIAQSSGVSFSNPATPGNLPGANNVTPHFTTTSIQVGTTGGQHPRPIFSVFSAGANNSGTACTGVSSCGVNSNSEFVTLSFLLANGKNFGDVISAMESGALRIGLHVQSIGGLTGGSDSYINNPTPVPVPAALPLFASGLAGLGWLSRRRKRLQVVGT
jgi:hypothetical protein